MGKEHKMIQVTEAFVGRRWKDNGRKVYHVIQFDDKGFHSNGNVKRKILTDRPNMVIARLEAEELIPPEPKIDCEMA